MSNEDSRNVPDTRGRPRSSSMAVVASRIEKAYLTNKLPFTVEAGPDVQKFIKKLRASAAYKDVQKELAEGNITLAIVTGKDIPGPKELNLNAAAYLNGLGETVGELRRYLLDAMRDGDLSRSEELLTTMDDIYSVLVTLDFPDAITGGLRRTTDMVRGVLEKTRSDLTLTIRQKALEWQE